MPTTTTTYSFNKPVVGADEDDWGGYLNGNWDSVDNLLDGTTPVTGIDINSGTLDGVTIGGTTAGAGTFTTLTANTSITGTLATAAQPNITSVGSLTSLDVAGAITSDGLTVDTALGSISATDSSLEELVVNASGYTSIAIHSDRNTNGQTLGSFAGYGKDSASSDVLYGRMAFEIEANTAGTHDGLIRFQTVSDAVPYDRLKIASNGDISFYEDTGTTPKFFWDASAERLGIGNSSPATALDVTGTITSDGLTVDGAFQLNGDITVTDTSGDPFVKLETSDQIYVIRIDNDVSDILQVRDITNSANRLGIASNGDISFYEDTGTTAKFFWDASAESLGIGTSSPDKDLTVSGEVKITGSLPRLFFDNTSDGIGEVEAIGLTATDLRFGYAQDNIVFRSNSSERMRIDSSGNVGIGTSSPNYALDVEDSGGGFIKASFVSTGSTHSSIVFDNTGSSANSVRVGSQNNDFYVRTSGTERMRIDSSGNVGIGTSNPLSILHVGSGSDANVPITLAPASGGNIEFRNTSSTGSFSFTNANGTSEAMRIDSSGNVGIGVTPTRQFHIHDASGDNNLHITNSTTGTTATDGFSIVSQSSTNDVLFNQREAANIIVLTSGAERMRIDSSGNLLVGTTSSYGGKVNINGSGYTSSAAVEINGAGTNNARSLACSTALLTSSHGMIQLGTANPGNGYFLAFSAPDGGYNYAIRGSISLSGTSVAYNTSSDYRLKENVVNLTGATTRLKQLEPKRFNFIADADTTVDGFIAHEVQTVVPEAITGTKDEVDAEGNPVYQGIDQSKLVPLLVATIKELEARITALENA
jgi:hypothetical protein